MIETTAGTASATPGTQQGLGRFAVVDLIEQVERWLDPEQQPFGVVGEDEAIAALCAADELGELLAWRASHGEDTDTAVSAKLEDVRARAQELYDQALLGHLEASIAELGWPIDGIAAEGE